MPPPQDMDVMDSEPMSSSMCAVKATEDAPHGPMREKDIIEFTHDHDFWHLVGALFNKFPDKDFPDVHSVETKSFEYDPDTKILRQTRLFSVHNPAPYLLRMVFKAPYWHFEETSVVDFAERTIELKSVNLDFRSIVDTYEQSWYKVDPDDASRTYFKQVAGLALNSLACLGMNGPIEKHALSKVKKSAALSVKLFEKKLARLSETPKLNLPGVDLDQIKANFHEG